MKRIAGVCLAVVLVAWAGCRSESAPPNPGSPGGAPSADGGTATAPEIEAGYWINSEPLTLAGLRGKIVVVEFWATWCPPCRTSIPHLIEMHKRYGPEGVVFISLTNEPQDVVERFVKSMGMPYAVGGGSSTGRAYGVRGIPRAFVVDAEGRIVWEGHPMKDLDKAIEKALESGA